MTNVMDYIDTQAMILSKLEGYDRFRYSMLISYDMATAAKVKCVFNLRAECEGIDVDYIAAKYSWLAVLATEGFDIHKIDDDTYIIKSCKTLDEFEQQKTKKTIKTC